MIIYLISSELNNNTLYKIGITKRNINKRLNELKTGNPATLSVIHTFESKYAPKIEKHFHKSKASSNVGGEWFQLSEQDIANFIPQCILLHDNLDLLSKYNTWIIDKQLL
jgi:hypothetical protein